ncbi:MULTISPECIES: hypothetical protein [unclassified Rhizobacter]|uniref:hypothetical protein n=1 Tax=unclassified Rhizobacter TaxID=2640088 RepID=UPI000B14F669|nr:MULTISPECIES: hypothetical protein [unclassified Rhizobacter]
MISARLVSPNRRLHKFLGSIALLLAATLSSPVGAWDGLASGKVTSIDVTGGSNYGFRVVLDGGTQMCAGGTTWAFLNETDSNYKTYVAALMVAKVQGTSVRLFTTTEGGFCHIGYISIAQ